MKTNFKRVVCVMMSSIMMASGFGVNKAAAMWPFSSDPLNKALNDAEKTSKEEMSRNVRLMADALKIFCEHETYAELSAVQKKTVQKFFTVALQGMNTLGLDLEVAKKMPGMKGIMKDYTDGMANMFQKLAGPGASQAQNNINDFEDVVAKLVDPQYVDANQKIKFPDANASDTVKDTFYGHLYNKTRMLFKGSIEQRIPRMKEELSDGPMAMAKRVFSNPLFILFAVSMAFKTGADAFDAIRSLTTELAHHFQELYYKVTAKKFDLDHYPELLDRIETRLREELVGQDEAIDQVIDIMRGYFQSMLEARAHGKKFEGGLMLYLTGSPATGKSTMMKIIQEEMHLNNFEAKMSDIVEDKGNKADSVAARLTKETITETKFKKIHNPTPLMRQLAQNKPTLYAFDEIDKMRRFDRQLQGNKSELGNIDSIDEVLRNFIDTGHIAGVNASGSILIATSNETDEDMMLLDSSLRNRYSQYRVKFRDFNKEDYKEIIRRGSVELQDHYADTFNTDVEWNENAMDYFATKFVKEQAGGRCAEPLMMKIRSAIAVLSKTTDISNKMLSINISEGEDKHIIIDVLGDVVDEDDIKENKIDDTYKPVAIEVAG